MSTNTSVSNWYSQHDYDAVLRRLRRVRKRVILGELDQGAEVLKKSYVFAKLSIQTPKERHERAYEMWNDGLPIDEAAASVPVVWDNRKSNHILRTFNEVDWRELALEVRDCVVEERLRDLFEMQDRLYGVSYNKWGFTLAMAGVWEAVCADTNVQQHFGLDERIDFRSSQGIDWYMGFRDLIKAQVHHDVPAFIAQWAIYDYRRQEHSKHSVFFNSIL